MFYRVGIEGDYAYRGRPFMVAFVDVGVNIPMVQKPESKHFLVQHTYISCCINILTKLIDIFTVRIQSMLHIIQF